MRLSKIDLNDLRKDFALSYATAGNIELGRE
jgi:hypothetical protein